MELTNSLFTAARHCLLTADVEDKLRLSNITVEAWRSGRLQLSGWTPADQILEAGRPARPQLVHASQVPRRGLGSEQGRLALIHAIAHIEFNAINLAWDAVQRFSDLPAEFYGDWVRVADEEAHHFHLLRQRLQEAGADYGDFAAHNGLWDMAMRTAHDPLVRMALVPRMLEARGLDVTPGMIKRLRQLGDHQTVQVLQLILDEEIGHVALGSRWFSYLCRQRGLQPEVAYFDLLNDFLNGEIRCPLHRQARLEAGFSERELDRLEALCVKA
jgi:uncharacterized ferritin-like protein (DUF455 family)